MKGILAAGAAVAILGGSLYLGLDGKGGDVGPTDPVAIVEELRHVVLPGECPASMTAEAARCEEAIQLDGRCLCKSRQKVGTVDGELADASALPAGKRTRLVACPGKDKGQARVYWEADVGEPRPGCVVAARPLVTVTVGDMETGLTRDVRGACNGWQDAEHKVPNDGPCRVTGNSWGRCPGCTVEPGGCAEACR